MKSKILNIPETNFGGVYALVDQKGKKYIGSSKDIKKRIIFHDTHIKEYLQNGRDGYLNYKMQKAIDDGAVFRCEILATFLCEMSSKEMRAIERVFVEKYGGIKDLYNCVNITNP